MVSGNQYFKIARVAAFLLVITAIIMATRLTKSENNLPNGFYTPIIALEFIQTTQEVQQFFTVKDIAAYEEDLLFGNNADYAFMLFYSTLLFFIALDILKVTRSKWMYVVMFLCVVMLLSDALENMQIAQIILFYKTASIVGFLCKLSIFTWLKWSSIALSFLLFAPYFLKGNWFRKIIGSLGITAFLLYVAAFFHHGILNEIFSTNIVLVFVLLVIFVFIHKEEIAH